MKRLFSFMMFGLITVSLLFAGSEDREIVVGQVIVTGNRVTAESVILREMHHRVGSPFDVSYLESERNRIYSLGLFNRVEIYYSINENYATIVVDVHERWYIFPVPIFGIKDRDWNKVFYGLGVLHDNFRGRNEKLWVGFALGYDPWVSLFYRNPDIFGGNEYFIESEFVYTETQNKSIISAEGVEENFSEERYIYDILFGKRFSLYTSVSVGIGYREVRLDQYIPGHTMSHTGVDKYLRGGMSVRYDTRDIIEYPMSGSFILASLIKGGFPGGTLDYVRTRIDARRYLPIHDRISLAGRALSVYTLGGEVPRHANLFIGYEEKIRGHFNEVQEGKNLFLSSFETRFRLFGPRYIEFPALVVPQFSILRYGLNAVLFADIGTTWDNSNARNKFKPAKGFGAGLHLIFPYSTVLRFEYALNESLEGEFIFDLFVMF